MSERKRKHFLVFLEEKYFWWKQTTSLWFLVYPIDTNIMSEKHRNGFCNLFYAIKCERCWAVGRAGRDGRAWKKHVEQVESVNYGSGWQGGKLLSSAAFCFKNAFKLYKNRVGKSYLPITTLDWVSGMGGGAGGREGWLWGVWIGWIKIRIFLQLEPVQNDVNSKTTQTCVWLPGVDDLQKINVSNQHWILCLHYIPSNCYM